MSGAVRRHHAKQKAVRAARVAAYEAGEPPPEIGYADPGPRPVAPIEEPTLAQAKAKAERKAELRGAKR